ncbi:MULTISPECIES: hypothetical protein [Mesorhizobium]|nr:MULTISPECIES: hypothetical protein [Mesorhizobium]ESY63876.1 hypothetical protein X742_27625 [Mesorhizobium sp. LNHC232B00]
MDHAITIGDVLIASAVSIAVVGLGGLAAWVLSLYAKGMPR